MIYKERGFLSMREKRKGNDKKDDYRDEAIFI